MECPNCHSAEHHQVIWGLRNFGAALANVGNTLFWMKLWPFVSIERITTPAKPLLRKCLKCGYRFMGATPLTPDFNECPQCGYNLTGNISGRCPECAWKLTRRYRAYRRITDRALSGGMRTTESRKSI